MNVKTELLSTLANAGGQFISGAALAEKLGVSRNAVWKAVKALEAEGFSITSVTSKGYRLNNDNNILSESLITPYLNTKEIGRVMKVYDTVDSTNNICRELETEKAPNGTTVIADRQTAGKGRRGKNWISPAGNCYFSILLYPDVRVDRASMVTLVAAIAVSEAVREVTGIDTRIKWPNDVVAGGKKICGILTESSTDMEYIQYVVVGIGINCNQKEFENEIKDMATSISLETGKNVERAKLLAKVFEHFERYYTLYLETEDLSKLYDRYNELLINKDRDVKIIENGRERIMKAIGINEVGALIVEDSDGRQETVISGEVSVRGLYGYV